MRPLLVSGPCALEDRETTEEVAAGLIPIAEELGFDLVFKASFDKANRSSGRSYRGPGLAAGLAVLGDLKERLGLRILTDVHEPGQAAAVAEIVDVLQIPAFLCRQTDLLIAAASTGRPVNLKKGQFLAPWLAGPAVQKLRDAGAGEVWLTERGTSFGHGDLVVDFRALPVLQATGCPVLFDASHSAQKPGARGESSGGDRSVIPVLADAAAGAGFDGLYLEVHPDPARARSDADTQWPLASVRPLLERFSTLWRCHRALNGPPT